jgi:hypothetical protein
MNCKPVLDIRNERGSALIVTVLILLAVTVIGILSTRSATIELQIAGHDKVHKMTWFATDAVCDGLVPELIEQNIEQRGFGDQLPPFKYGNSNDLDIHTSEFYLNETCAVPSETNRDIEMTGLAQTDVSVVVFGDTRFLPGNAIQLPEGYHGRGKGLAGGGAQIVYIIRGFGRGAANSQARVTTGWRHVM